MSTSTKELAERECYQCGKKKTSLSYRSRCLTCETERADFNENENEELRHRLAELEQQNRELLAHVEKWKEVAAELGHLMDGVREGEYKPDSFTNQPLRILLNKTPTQSLQLLTEQEIKKIFIDGLKVGVDTRISGALPNGMTVNEVAHEYARNWSGADKQYTK